jgi:MSHA biogenesis protein MshP
MKMRFRFVHSVVRSAGMGLVTAIFLLVVLAGLGVAMMTLFTTQQATSSLDELGARAYQAARAGVEWGIFQQMQKNVCANSTFALPSTTNTTLSGFTVTVSCTPIGGGSDDPLERYVISASACNIPDANSHACPNASTTSPDYVARQIEVEL